VVDVSIVMPCLNEQASLGHCIAVARRALDLLEARHAMTGEIVIADNASTDGSQELARGLGARVVTVTRRGYGAAVCGGFEAARGRYLVMGDADGSYDFLDAVPMVEALMNGADICMGSRFQGDIKPGAMPWKNRYIGNPILTGILNLLFRSDVDDAHCGLRALTKSCFERLRLDGAGMEFASEMIIKAALLNQRLAQIPVTLWPDQRGRPPHLRPWRDGWRHLRYLLMLSPYWLFAIPAGLLAAASLAILMTVAVGWLSNAEATRFGNYWAILAGASLTLSHIGIVLALAGQLYGIREHYRRAPDWLVALSPWLTLEAMLIAGFAATLFGLSILTGVFLYWSAHGLAPIANVFPAVAGTCAVAIGMQNVLGGFLLAIVSGNEAEFLQSHRNASTSRATEPRAALTETAAGRMPDLRVVHSPAIAPTSQAEPASRAESMGL
jgi:glycosyltransferase involved in cell wall biosynthesis